MQVSLAEKVGVDFMTINTNFQLECDNDSIYEKVKSFLKKYTNSNELNEDQEIFTKGLINSLLAMQMVLFLEKEYSFQILNEDLDIKNFNTLRAIAEFVIKKINVIN